MKANELMVGDWVLCDNTPYQIAEIGGMVCISAEQELFAALEDINPVPLTPEILERNGFIVKHPESEKRTYWRDCAGQIVGHKNRGMMYFDISGNPVKFGDFHPHFHGHIRFVHELQHALRLCGIDKEIVL